MNNLEQLREWKNAPTKDKILAKGLKKINEKNVDKFFGETMTFGTAGIRGILGPGTNMINEFTIAAAAYAYGATLVKQSELVKKMGLVIAHDNRSNGALFAEITAKVFDHLGIKTYIFKNNEMAATPLLSYAIRKLRAAGGVNITASHNPKEYNGFKVYNAQGAQLLPELTVKISKLMSRMNFLKVPYGLFNPTFISPTLQEDYIKDVLSIRKRPNDSKKLIVVYSALNGTGSHIAPTLFQKMDIEYYAVKQEVVEDATFKGLKSCNPEDEAAYNRAIKLAKKKKADIIILTDPDADRVGLAVRGPLGSYKKINGNQTGAIVLNHILRTKQYNKEGYIAQSVVSGNVTKEMAKRHNLSIHETHVGFKNIARVILDNPEGLVMGYEESFGQLMDPEIARDKDAFQGLVMLVEAANYLKTQNMSLLDELERIGVMYGVHTSTQLSKQIEQNDVQTLLDRVGDILTIGKFDVSDVLDFRKEEIMGLENATLVKVILENGSWFAVRPSGTEPKVKVYIETVGATKKETEKTIKQITSTINEIVSGLKKEYKSPKAKAAEVKETKKAAEVIAPIEKTEREMLAEQRAQFEREMKEAESKQEQVPATQEVEEEPVPEFSVETISPIPAEKTPSQLDPKQIQKTKEIKLQEQRKTQEVKTKPEETKEQ
ncbi:phospho-sugar mutase [Mycoplasma todarodis]|uniref:Phosphoglucomutase n=1 Tax=Mycoplasma todarodis TaxID=1937191 RepID=A0A4R0XN22_9MOLU|nr:phospho-sugar mutase [Mycoplasma todarodis]TCG12121.1 hypothetical protein C4B25_00300 [Mycoplasma todarodis]